MNKKDKKQLIFAILTVLVITVVVSGGTYAYWRWSTSEEELTTVTVTVGGGQLNITGNNVSSTSMYPTNSCSGSAALIGSATVTAINETSTNMTASLKLRMSLYAKQGTLTSQNLAHLHWAIVDTTSATSKTCSNPDYQGTFNTVTPATVQANFPNTTYTDIDTGITFDATNNDTVTKTYAVYVWLDSEYEFTNTGSTVSDPMQDLSISVKWSPASTLVQS